MSVKKLSLLFCSLALLIILGACSDEEKKEVKDTNPVVATVNGVEIKQDFIDKTYEVWLFIKGNNDKNEKVDVKADKEKMEEAFHYGRRESSIVKTNLLRYKISGMVLEKYYKDKKEFISDEELEQKYVDMMDIMKEKKPEVLDFYSENKIDKDFIKDGLKTNYYLTKYAEDIDNKFREEFDLSEEDYKNFKLNVNIAVILVQDKKTADDVYKKIQDGAKFEDMVKEYSIDESSKVRDGELGLTKLEDLPIEFSINIEKMKKDQISKPFKSPFGYNIVKLLDYKTVDDMLKDEELTESEEASTKSLVYNRKFQIKFYEEVNKLVDKADVKMLKDFYKEEAEK